MVGASDLLSVCVGGTRQLRHRAQKLQNGLLQLRELEVVPDVFEAFAAGYVEPEVATDLREDEEVLKEALAFIHRLAPGAIGHPACRVGVDAAFFVELHDSPSVGPGGVSPLPEGPKHAIAVSWQTHHVPDDFVVARNPDADSSLPYLVRIPLGPQGIVLKVRDSWPRTSKVYCHRADEWPEEIEIVERIAVRSCVKRGAAIDLVLERGQENRSQFVITRIRGGREAIFWQSPRTTKQARPNVGMPVGRAQGSELTVIVDSHERYPYTFKRQSGLGHVRTVRRGLPAGDYAVELDGRVVVSVERKSLADLSSSLLNGKLRFAMADLASLPRAAVVVEERYSKIFAQEHVRPSVVADALAEAQVRCPTVPVVFAETRSLAEEWTYRYLAAGLSAVAHGFAELDLPAAGPIPEAEPSVAQVRAWARANGIHVPDRGRLRPEVWQAYRDAAGT